MAPLPANLPLVRWIPLFSRRREATTPAVAPADAAAPAPRKPRLAQLDILRGVAILLVLGHHCVVQPDQAGVLRPLVTLWRRFGWTGVDLFFVLSGFLVGGLLFKELRTRSSLDAPRFLLRRGLKIWPGYFAFLLFLFVLLVAHRHFAPFDALKVLGPNLLHIQNYLFRYRPRLHLWSLAVEEHFYLILTALLWLLARRARGRLDALPQIPILAVSLMIFCTVARYLTRQQLPAGYGGFVMYATHLRVDGLFFGVLLGYLYHFRESALASIARYRALLLLAGLALVSPMMVLDWRPGLFVTSLGLTMLYVGYGCLLLVMVYTRPGAGLLGRLVTSFPARVVAFIGYYSYAVYLWHLDLGRAPLLYLLGHGFLAGMAPELKWLCATLLYVTAAVLGGVVCGRLIELPALALRDRLYPSRADALSAAQP
jgi:peptidoglycan/LPS O-acetylase OafA/YrhL